MTDQPTPNKSGSVLPAVRDCLAMLGLLGLGTGLWIERPSLCLMIIGSLVLVGSLYGTWRAAAPPKKREEK